MRNQSTLQHSFAAVPAPKVPRSVFNRSHGWKGTFDCDWLIPFYVDEAIAGDTFNMKCNILLRLNSPTIKPVMDNVWVTVIFFSVANRLLWTNWKKFMGEQVNPADSISYTVPQITGPNVAGGGIPIGHLFDYMGLPVGPLSGGGATTGITFNNLHGRAYNQFFNAWVRDENLQNSVTEDLGDGPDTFTNYNLLKRGRRFDYFGAALPWAQKGGTSVPIPLGTTATVRAGDPATFNDQPGSPQPIQLRDVANAPLTASRFLILGTPADANTRAPLNWASTGGASGGNNLYPSNLYADLSTASAATLNSLRQSITLQQFLERDARGGTRWPELLLNHFGVTLPDASWRPELLSIYTERLNITPVAQTTPKPAAGTTTDQGNLSGFGTYASQRPQGFQKTFLEHSVVMGLICITADLSYQQGMDFMWSRRTRYDYPFPIFATLGERAIKNREIYANLADGTGAAAKDGTFGYVPQYEEMRFKDSKITGNLRSYNGAGVNANTLDVWHLAEAYSSQPTLGATWIQAHTPMDRVIAVPAQDHFICDAYFDLKCARVLPVFGIPGLTRI